VNAAIATLRCDVCEPGGGGQERAGIKVQRSCCILKQRAKEMPNLLQSSAPSAGQSMPPPRLGRRDTQTHRKSSFKSQNGNGFIFR